MSVAGTASAVACLEQCKRGFGFSASTGRCMACAAGTFSAGGMAACLTCVALGYGANAYVDARRSSGSSSSSGCIQCGLHSELVPATANTGAGCRRCAEGRFVAVGATACAGCDRVGQYYPINTAATGCVDCPLGTFKRAPADAACTLCPANTYSGGKTALVTACKPCPNGTRHSVNRTVCIACETLVSFNRTLLLFPFVEHFQAGCAVRCKPGVSYQRTNVYAVGGCGDCAAVTSPVGMYKVVAS